jgi:flagellar assembly factor FliW
MLRGEYLMTGSGPAMLSQTVAERPETEAVETRFGQVTIYRKNPIIFPAGLLGMPDKMQFCLTNFPSAKLTRFKLLQSLEDLSLSFITLPLDYDNPVVARADLEQAAKDLGLPGDQMATLLIVSVHREPGGVRLSVNARAPIFLHTTRRLATQHVFPHTKYDIRHMITI